MSHSHPLSVSGVIPSLAMGADLGPPRSECGIGALMPWADRLWAVTYVSHTSRDGTGTGLYEIDADLRMTKRPESRDGTYANRFIHYKANKLVIGPHVIDAERNVRTVEELVNVRLTGVMEHLHEPDRLVYVLGMEGELFELDLHSLSVTQIDDLTERFGISKRVHFKAGYTGAGRVVVANNTYGPEEFAGEAAEGLLAEWDGGAGADSWRVIERNPFVEVIGRRGFGGTMFATGWDRASAILMVHTSADDTWRRYRLPKASHTFDHMWQTEWPRIRETEHERYILDCHGMFYELSPWVFNNRVWGVKPIASHLWVVPDFCSYRGMLVLGSDNASPSSGLNALTGEPVSGLWFGKTDDLWNFGPRAGWGGPWWKTPVQAGEPSDPYLMTGFDKKSLHLTHDANAGVEFRVEVDFLGDGSWQTYDTFAVSAGGYAHHEFLSGFGAHWLRLWTDRDCTATGYLWYG